jgi:hypothetical protein
MGKLFKLKRWLTLPEAARYLSVVASEEVSETDVLRLALDGELTLSTHFVNNAVGQRGSIVPLSEAKVIELPRLDGSGSFRTVKGIWVSEDQIIELEDEVIPLSGVWDLPMLGAEELDVEHLYQTMTGGPAVELTSLDGAFVTDGQGVYCRLLERFERANAAAESEDSADDPSEAADSDTVEPADDPSRPAAKEPFRPFYDPRNFYPAGTLPLGSVFVVRTSALRELESRIAVIDKPAETSSERPLARRERTTLLVIIGALAKLAGFDESKPSSAATAIESQTALMGARVATRTILNHLKLVSAALEDRGDG